MAVSFLFSKGEREGHRYTLFSRDWRKMILLIIKIYNAEKSEIFEDISTIYRWNRLTDKGVFVVNSLLGEKIYGGLFLYISPIITTFVRFCEWNITTEPSLSKILKKKIERWCCVWEISKD
jgi:hypothetical protein